MLFQGLCHGQDYANAQIQGQQIQKYDNNHPHQGV